LSLNSAHAGCRARRIRRVPHSAPPHPVHDASGSRRSRRRRPVSQAPHPARSAGVASGPRRGRPTPLPRNSADAEPVVVDSDKNNSKINSNHNTLVEHHRNRKILGLYPSFRIWSRIKWTRRVRLTYSCSLRSPHTHAFILRSALRAWAGSRATERSTETGQISATFMRESRPSHSTDSN